MHYITEGELRRSYAQEHFDTFKLPAGARLTPSARQFLIDFRIDFESLYYKKNAVNKEKHVAHEDSHQTQALKDDMRILGARLRLLSRKALGINNDTAHLLECVGSAWQKGKLAQAECCSDDQQEKSVCKTMPEVIPSLPLNACVHPVYFEMAVMCGELLRFIHFWNMTCSDEHVCSAISSWTCQASTVFYALKESMEQVEEETSCD
ncbi:hypothetical protein [Atopobium fossor]|uniref:hypothetical protein n=1 Tax=Atopobium fossor TaxID=39487 RepID=UPI000424D519|nr:hypothetical protein [Atopobium fossor]